ncbi:MAG: hypothetical protein ACI4L9_04480 [Candidatus Coproplasma sp.]
MKKYSVEQLKEKFSSCPTKKCVYEGDGKTYLITRRYTSEKELNEEMLALALEQADGREGNIL